MPCGLAAIAIAGCLSEPPPPTARRDPLPVAPPVSRGDREPAGPVATASTATPDAPIWQLRSAGNPNGAGGARWHVELDARQFPARALDPVLDIDGQRVTSYRYVSPTVLRFEVPPAIALRDGSKLSIVYGTDERTRRVLTTALELSRAVP